MTGKKILIIEDNASIAELVATILENEGYEITDIVETGEEGLTSVALNHPDVVISDINLAGKIDGIETAGYISHLFKLPIIFMTGATDHETIEKAKSAEPYGYLSKPFNKNEFLSTVSVAIRAFELNMKVQGEYTGNIPISIKNMSSHDEGIMITNSLGKILYINPYIENLTGFSSADIIFKSVSEMLQFSDADNISSANVTDEDIFMQYNAFTSEKTVYLKENSGGTMIIKIKIIPRKYRDEITIGAIIALKEISEVKSAGVRDSEIMFNTETQEISA